MTSIGASVPGDRALSIPRISRGLALGRLHHGPLWPSAGPPAAASAGTC